MSRFRTARRARLLAAGGTLALLAFAFVGRAVNSSDGAEVVSETLGFLVQGRFEAATLPLEETPDPAERLQHPAFHSRYGLFPSILPLPFAAAAWPFRRLIGGAGVDAAVSLTWGTGVALAALAFVRLVRVISPEASPWWGPAFVAGTFLWPYAGDSYVEPWAGAALTWGAAGLLDLKSGVGARAGVFIGAAFSVACLLKPILWITLPGWLWIALQVVRKKSGAERFIAGFLGTGLVALALSVLLNLTRTGSVWDVGYGRGTLAFLTPMWEGVVGLTVGPGRGILFYAPVIVLSIFSFRRLPRLQQAALFGIPLLLLLVVARWWAWHGASAWGPRLLLPVLPLLAAPAAIRGLRRAVWMIVVGALLNVGGVLVPAGAFSGYVERLRSPEVSTWPKAGPDRISTVAMLSPLFGHPWLLLRGAGLDNLPAPWLVAGATAGIAPPRLEETLSPLVLRQALGLPPIRPFVPRLLTRTAWGYAARGRPAEARRFLVEALLLDSRDPDALQLRAVLGP